MKKNIQNSVFWSIWGSLLVYYFYMPISVRGKLPTNVMLSDIEWHWVIGFMGFCLLVSIVFRFICEKKREDKKKLLPYFVAGIAFANTGAPFSTYLVVTKNPTVESIVWFTGLLGMLIFFPAFLLPRPEPVAGGDATRWRS